MKILAFDTSSVSGSIALVEDNTLVAELTSQSVAAHAVWLLPNIEGFLKGLALSVHDIDLFAVVSGPGSFTGLRIGVSAVKGLAWSSRKKVVGISSLYALALNARSALMPVCPVLDARKGEVYAALYRCGNGGMENIMAESVITPAELCERIAASGIQTPVVFSGSALNAYADDIKRMVKDALFAPEPLWHIRASNVALAAFEKLRTEEPLDPAGLALVYLRKSVSQINPRRV